MSRLTNCVVVASLVLTSISVARGQAAPPLNDPKFAQEQFREFIPCAAYWKIISQCLSIITQGRLEQKDQEKFDHLSSAGSTFSGWLGDKAKLSEDVQRSLEGQTKDRMFSSIGGKCDNAMTLVPTYRDKCAALLETTDAWIKEDLERQKKDDLSDADTVKDVEMDCTGTLEPIQELVESDESVVIH